MAYSFLKICIRYVIFLSKKILSKKILVKKKLRENLPCGRFIEHYQNKQNGKHKEAQQDRFGHHNFVRHKFMSY